MTCKEHLTCLLCLESVKFDLYSWVINETQAKQPHPFLVDRYIKNWYVVCFCHYYSFTIKNENNNFVRAQKKDVTLSRMASHFLYILFVSTAQSSHLHKSVLSLPNVLHGNYRVHVDASYGSHQLACVLLCPQ